MKINKNPFIRMVLAAAAVLAGAAYLALGEGALPVVLPLMCLCFLGIAAVSWREARASGTTGWAAMLPAVSAVIVAVFAVIGTAVYFVNG